MFQFTHPGRGATELSVHLVSVDLVSIHAPREGCDSIGERGATSPIVSIHAPREGCDEIDGVTYDTVEVFQFTHPGRGATLQEMLTLLDMTFQFTHPGRGATYVSLIRQHKARRFQFTHPGRGATYLGC